MAKEPDLSVPEGSTGLVYDPLKKRSRKVGKFHKEGTEKQKAWGRSEANLANLARARAKIKEGDRGGKVGWLPGARGRTGRKILKQAKEKARKVAEKAFAAIERTKAQQYVEDGIVNRDILGNTLLMEAAEIVLARWPDDHPDETKAGQHCHGLDTRLKYMQLIAPYILSKPEQKISTRNETVEDYLLRMADEDEADEVLDVTPEAKALEG